MLPLVLILAEVAAPTFTMAQARTMTPAQLGDAMLEPGHPPIREITIGPVPMRSLTELTLVGVPGPASERGWCRQVNWRVTLKPVDPKANVVTTDAPSAVATREPIDLYRRASEGCGDTKATFFTIFPEMKADQFAFVDRMLALRQLARGRRRLPFTVTCRDEDGPQTGDVDRCRRDGGRKLLASLPIDQAFNVLPAGTSMVFTVSSRTGPSEPHTVSRPGTLGTYEDGLVIDVEATTRADGTITSIALHRHIPFPF